MLPNEIEPRALFASASPWAVSAALAAALMLSASVASAADTAQGLRVVKDSVTGELRAPTAEEAAALDNAGNARSVSRGAVRGMRTGRINPQAVRHANGAVEQELDESSLNYSVATKGPGGRINTYCVTGPTAAAAILKGDKGVMKTAKEHDLEEK